MPDFLRLLRVNWTLAAAALFAVVVFRCLLWIAPFRWLRQINSAVKLGPGKTYRERRRRVSAAVRIASRCVPKATCLTQALATQVLLRLRGEPCEFCLGVTRGERGDFKAHAWIESEGEVLIGALPDLDQYRRFAVAGAFS